MTDDRYKQLMADVGMPDSVSLSLALQQVANEVAQETRAMEHGRITKAFDGVVRFAIDSQNRGDDCGRLARLVLSALKML